MSRTPFDGEAEWIWGPGGVTNPPTPESGVRTCYFRRPFDAPAGATLTASVSADSRYRLFLNGERVRDGPGISDPSHQPYDTAADLPLREGENVLAAVVVSFAGTWGGPYNRMAESNAFVLDGAVRDGDEVIETLHTGDSWLARHDDAYSHEHRPGRDRLAGVDERLDGRAYPTGWTTVGYDDGDWPAATAIEPAARRDDDHSHHRLPYRLVERPIPDLEEGRERFDAAHQVEGVPADAVDDLLSGAGEVTVPADTAARFVLDAGTNTTGYPVIELDGGRGAALDLTYGEAWHVDGEKSFEHDPERGEVRGHGDAYVAGSGEQRYRPLDWRAFRYVAVEVETADRPLTLRDPRYRFTAYPFAERASFDSSEGSHDRLWDAAWRTVRLCAHDTFEDCPYYERLQYAGDTHPVMLYAGYVSGDWRLARQAVRQFDRSRDHHGLTKSRYPSRVPQHIPSWSLLWVRMVRDYWWHSGDADTPAAVLDGVDATLGWFADRETDDGVVADLPYWKVVDWVPGWEPRGVPPGAMGGISGVINLQYAAALRDAAELHDALGDGGRAATYRDRADTVTAFVNDTCWDADAGLYRDRPGGDEASELGNAWAILAGAATGERARIVADRMATDDDLNPASLYGRYYVLRALSEAGAYGHAADQLDIWREILSGTDLTTLPERPGPDSSHCHAWSSAPLYEFLAEVCGVTPAAPGFDSLRVAPSPLDLDRAAGTVPTPRGEVRVEWDRDGGFSLALETPEEVGGTAVLPDGREADIPAAGTRLEL